MKYTLDEYLHSGYWDGEMDSEVEHHQTKIVKCRKQHQCSCGAEIKAGEHAMLETGFMDGEPVSCYTCLPCIDKWLDELHEHDNDDDNELEAQTYESIPM